MPKKQKVLTESTKSKLSKFIMAISSKNYAQANKYLKGAVEDKILNRISKAANEPLF